MRKFIWITTLSLSFLFLGFVTNIDASILETSIDRTFTANQEYMLVEEIKTTTVSRAGFKVPAGESETFIIQNFIKGNENEKLEFIENSLTVKNSNGENVQYNIERNDTGIKISVPFTRELRYGDSETFTISYKSKDLVNKNGKIYDIYITPFSTNYQFESEQDTQTFTTRLRIPNSLPEVNFAIPNNRIKTDDDFRIIEIETSQLIGNFAWIQLGTQQIYDFKLSLPIKPSLNNISLYNSYEIAIPRSINTARVKQSVYYTEFTPEPTFIRKDSEDNLIAVFNIPANESSEITIYGYAIIDQLKTDIINNSGNLTDLEDSKIELESLLAPSDFWEVDHPEIMAKANSLKDSENIYEIVEKTYQDIVNSIDYSEVDRFGLTERKGALSTLRGGGAVCMEYSDLFITLIRAQGIPARAAYGHGFDSRVPIEEQVGHQWAEVYFPGIEEWVAVDVTWGESGQKLIGGDLNHLYTHIASQNPDSPPQVKTQYYGIDPLDGNLKFEINATDSISKEQNLMSTEEILSIYEYKEPTRAQKILNEVVGTIAVVDASLTIFIGQNISNSPLAIYLIKVVIYSIPIIIISSIFKGFRKRRKRKIVIKEISKL